MVSGVITQPYTLTIVTIVGIRQTSIRRITIALIRITTVDAIIKSTDAPRPRLILPSLLLRNYKQLSQLQMQVCYLPFGDEVNNTANCL